MDKVLAFFLTLGGALLAFPRQAGAALPTVTDLFAPPHQSTAFDNADLDTLARTLWGEARGQGYAGMQAVANVVMNRFEAAQMSVAKGRQFGFTVEQICKKPYQFSAWLSNDPNYSAMLSVTKQDSRFSMALDIAEKALLGTLPDITGGADHYLNIAATRELRGGSLPSWVDLDKQTAAIGAHTFLRLV
jgi:N-acetylmuramoyl-L-alanine amidase